MHTAVGAAAAVLAAAGAAVAVPDAVGAAPVIGAAHAATAVGTRPRPTPAVNGPVFAVAYRGDIVYLGGSFTGVRVGERFVARKRLAAFDTRTGALLAWRPAADGTVRALTVAGRAVYAAGDFRTVSGHHRDGLASLDAQSGTPGPFAPAVSGRVRALAVGHRRLYIGGRFRAVNGAARGNLAAFSLSGGALDRHWRPRADARVAALAVAGSRVYLGGAFHRVGGADHTSRLAAVTAGSGTPVRSFQPALPARVLALAVDAQGVYAAIGGTGGRAVAYTGAGHARWTRVFNGDVHTLVTLGGNVYLGGHFDTACRTASPLTRLGCAKGFVRRVKLAAVDAHGRLTGWAPRANGIVGVRAMAAHPTRPQIAAGGEFTRIDGARRERFAAFD